jgi:beta-1,4-N-acetylglucosaminyltransferase
MILPKTKKPKIFVTTGSSLEFDLLTTEIDKININKEFEIIVQTGKGKYLPKNCKFFDFDKSLDKYYDWADLVITHTGAGTLFELLYMNKKIISVSNPQGVEGIYEIAKMFDKEGYLKYFAYKNINQLELLIKKIINNKVKFKKYKLEKQEIGKEIIKFLKM